MGPPPENPQDGCISQTHPTPLPGLHPPVPDAKPQVVAGQRLPAVANLTTCVLRPLAAWRLTTALASVRCPLEPLVIHGTRPGRIEVIAGVMFSGKSEELIRSEEHTSELQSQSNLVCRLLLEKKKK